MLPMKSKLNSVLLIDDDEPTNFYTQLIVEESGCTGHIKVAQGGREALEYLSKSSKDNEGETAFPCPDLIFLDINMPAMDGWEFLDQYKKLSKESHGKVIVVMLTTSLNPDDRVKADGIPEISGFESKPLTEEKLTNILKQHFSGYFSDSH
jgi:CheY-like chemotaxis protein